MQEIAIKSHLIITNIHNEFNMNWCGRMRDANPKFDDQGRPIFAIVSSQSRIEIGTTNMVYLEECAKKITAPKGRSATTTDRAYIYLKEVGGNERLIGILTHNRVKTFAPMYDKVGWS